MAQVVQESDVVFKDQALKEQAEALLKKGANGTTPQQQMGQSVSTAAEKAASQGKAAASKALKCKGPAAAGSADGRGLALCYIGLGVSLLLLIGTVGPLVTPEFYENDSTGIAEALEEWSPLPQAGLAALVLALVAAIILLRRRAASNTPGVCDQPALPPAAVRRVFVRVVAALSCLCVKASHCGPALYEHPPVTSPTQTFTRVRVTHPPSAPSRTRAPACCLLPLGPQWSCLLASWSALAACCVTSQARPCPVASSLWTGPLWLQLPAASCPEVSAAAASTG